MKKIIFLIIIIITIYILGLFIFPKEVRNFWDSIWLSSLNNVILTLKEKSDGIVNSDINLKNIWSGVTGALDSATNYAKDLKSKVDSVRSTASGITHTYNEVKTQIDDTTKNIQEIWEKINEAKKSIDSVTNIIN